MLTRSAPPGIEREALLVTACAAGQLDRLSELMASPIDWATVSKLAARHGVGPVVAHGVLTQRAEAIPPEVVAQLREELRGTAARGLHRAGELLRVTAALDQAGVPAIPYKGPALAQILYGNLGLRDSVDLDILVRKDQVPRARDVLFGLGYALPRAISAATFAATLRSNCELGLVHPGGHLVELQWSFTPLYFPFPIDFDAMLGRRQEIAIGGGTTYTLGTEDLLTALCIHGAKHQWTRLSWIADVARLLDVSPALDRDAVQRNARSGRVIALGLALAEELNRGAASPPGDSEVAALAQRAGESLWREGPAGIWPQLRFYLAARPGLRDKAATLWRFAVTPTAGDCAAIDLPSSLGFLYYVVRPFRLLGTYVLRQGGRV
jgi:hypothetical protein